MDTTTTTDDPTLGELLAARSGLPLDTIDAGLGALAKHMANPSIVRLFGITYEQDIYETCDAYASVMDIESAAKLALAMAAGLDGATDLRRYADVVAEWRAHREAPAGTPNLALASRFIALFAPSGADGVPRASITDIARHAGIAPWFIGRAVNAQLDDYPSRLIERVEYPGPFADCTETVLDVDDAVRAVRSIPQHHSDITTALLAAVDALAAAVAASKEAR
jgi:hypothetical protein